MCKAYRSVGTMTIAIRPLTQIAVEALHFLYVQLGLVDTVRFLNQFTAGFGNYTEERRAVVETQTFDDALAEVRDYQRKHLPSE